MTYRQRQARKRRGRGSGRKRVGLVFLMLLAILLIGVLSAVGWVIAVAASAPDIKELKPIDNGALSSIYAADGSRLGYVQSDQVRTPIQWKDMPVNIRQAVVSVVA